MQIDKKWLSKVAAQEGFVRDTLEKVCRLTKILQFINSNPLMKDCLALKGGTAINLTVFNMPRLSVDIDLDYSKETDRERMLEDRRLIIEDIEKYMSAEGYQKSDKSKMSYSLDSMIFMYQNAAGIRDNVKLEINYSMRVHIYPLVYRQIQTGGVLEEFEVLSVDGTEIFGSDEITWYRIKTDLIPVKRKREKFDLDETKQRVKDQLEDMMRLTDAESRFLQEFREKKYHPEYLFEDQEIVSRLEKHPMASWKMQDVDR